MAGHPRGRTAAVGLGLALLVGCAGTPPGPTPSPTRASPTDVPAAPTVRHVTPPPPTGEPPGRPSPTVDAVAPGTFDYDAGVPLEVRVERPVGSTGPVRIERLTYAGVDGERVPALFAMPRGADRPVACVVLGHGFRGDKASFPIWDMLGRAGFATFAIDARFHGDRVDTAALERMATDPALLARMLRETVVDMRRGIDLLESRPECDPDRIGYLGASMGGFLGSLLAGADARVQAPVLLVSGADWPTMLGSDVVRRFRETATPEEVARARAVLNEVDPKHWVGRISPRPVLMINGERDDSVPPDSARALHRAAGEPKQVVWYDGGHAIPSGPERDRLLGIIGLWLLTHLSPG